MILPELLQLVYIFPQNSKYYLSYEWDSASTKVSYSITDRPVDSWTQQVNYGQNKNTMVIQENMVV